VSEATPVRTRARSSRSVADMIRSLVVVGGVVVILVLIVPRPSAVTQPPVDVAGIAQGAQSGAGFTLSVPADLPAEWHATSARLLDGTDNVRTWHAGYQTADAQYAAVEQAKNVTAVWLRANTQGGDPVGTTTVAGATWTQYLHQNRLQRTLLYVHGSVTTLVTGTASWADLTTLAARLRPPP
jgi:uncharacterized protein DUF4245